MRIQQVSRLITIRAVVVSALTILCVLMACQMRISQELTYERREAPVAREDLSV
jgi:hypothetical protein